MNEVKATNFKLGADKDKLLADFKQLMQKSSNETIQKLEQELNVLRAKRTSQAAFAASLCCYESIEKGQGIEVNENHVLFTGNASILLSNCLRSKDPSLQTVKINRSGCISIMFISKILLKTSSTS